MSAPVVIMVKAGRWSPQEDNSLCRAVQIHGPKKWALISGLVPGRTAKACYFRWHNEFSLGLNHGPFTIEEDRTLLRHYATMGRKWARIGRMLNGRSGNAVKNRFHLIQSLGLVQDQELEEAEEEEAKEEEEINDIVSVDPDHDPAISANALIDHDHELPTPVLDQQQVSESTPDPNLVQLINKIVNQAVDKSMSTLRDQMDRTISTLRNQMDNTVSTLRNQMDDTLPSLREDMTNNIAAIVSKEVLRYNNNFISKQK